MARAFEIAGRPVGGDAPVLFVAELSANHGGKLDLALKTIEAAKQAGADAIKLQTYTPDTLTLRSDQPPFVVRTENVWAGRNLWDLYAEAMTPWEWHRRLKEAAESLGMIWFSTPFDATATEFLEKIDVPAYKIASFELVDLPLIEHVAARGKPVIMSTGMASFGEILSALAVCRAAGNENIALLRCVSSYPAAPDDMHLQSLSKLRELDVVVGLSDHTRDETVALASVVLGAKLIEKHFILDRSIGGPDSFFSLEPQDFERMVKMVRAAETALGPPRFGPSTSEQPSLAFRRSLFVATDVEAGELLTYRNVRSVRPGNGLAARHLPEVLGRVATRRLSAATPLDWTMVGDPPAAAQPVSLRRARPDDARFLLELRNEETARKMSLSTAVVREDEHSAWLARTLSSPDHALFIAELGDGTAAGQVRLDHIAAESWRVSIALSPEHRGRGLGISVLRLLENEARELGAGRLTAVLRQENGASIGIFEKAGYYSFVARDAPEGKTLACERRIRPFA